jgi:hypothetical protein
MDALAIHKGALTLVGAHAVHERTRDVALRARETKDGDLALIPGMVSDSPLIESAMRGAGFKTLAELEKEVRKHNPDVRRRFESQPGLWGTGMTADGSAIGEVDLLVPTSIAGGGRRSARALKQHGTQTTRHTPGLELAVLDRSLMPIENFVDGTVREGWVAGHAGLDAVDVWRLLATSDGAEVRAVFERHLDDEQSGPAIRLGLDHLRMIVDGGHIRLLAAEGLVGTVPESDVLRVVAEWFEAFQA